MFHEFELELSFPASALHHLKLWSAFDKIAGVKTRPLPGVIEVTWTCLQRDAHKKHLIVSAAGYLMVRGITMDRMPSYVIH